MPGEGIRIRILPDGDLLLTADNETRSYLNEHRKQKDIILLVEMTEYYWANGQYEPFDAGQANPFVGLTDAPCIAESLDTHDDGKREIVGRCWWYPNYMIESPVDQLRTRGRAVFQNADKA